MTDTAVVILNFNGSALLRKFLPSVIQHSGEARIILVDNGSSDGSADVMAAEFPNIECIAIPTNLGFCGGYNHALKLVKAGRYVLLNSDVEVTPGWLGPMSDLLDRDPSIAAVQPKILSHHAKNTFEYAGAAGGLIDTLGYPFCRGRLFFYAEEDQGQYNNEQQIFWSSGACMMVQSKLFHAMGGFDEDFFAHMEEIDLCWRLQRAGYRIYFTPASSVYHVGGGTLSSSNPRKTYLNFRNGLSLIYKNLPASELVLKFPIRLILDWIASLTFVLSGSVRDGLAVWRAHVHFFRYWQRERRRRQQTFAHGFIRLESQYSGSIVWEFFILGRRKVSQLKH